MSENVINPFDDSEKARFVRGLLSNPDLTAADIVREIKGRYFVSFTARTIRKARNFRSAAIQRVYKTVNEEG